MTEEENFLHDEISKPSPPLINGELLLFNIYLLPLYTIIDKYPTIDYHSYADDIQLHCRLIDPNNYINLLTSTALLIYITGSPTTPYH